MRTVVFEVDDKYANFVTATFVGVNPSWGSIEANITCTSKEICGDCTKVVIGEDGNVVKDKQNNADEVKGMISDV